MAVDIGLFGSILSGLGLALEAVSMIALLIHCLNLHPAIAPSSFNKTGLPITLTTTVDYGMRGGVKTKTEAEKSLNIVNSWDILCLVQ
jgi:hypothetical protein